MGEAADIVGGGTPDTTNPDYWDGVIDWYSPVEIGEQVHVNGSKKKITTLGLQKSSAKVLPIGTVLFTSRAGIGNTAILSKEGATNQGFQSIVPHNNELDTYFIYSRSYELKRYGETNGAGSTFVEVSGKQMSQMPIFIPSLPEQTAIGNFFRTLDDAITLHKRKLDGLKELKKGCLQQMFPHKGESVPRVRFDGFAGAWEVRKLGDIFVSVSDKNFSHLPVLSASQEKGMVLRSELGIDIKYDINSLNTYKRIQQGQFAIHLRSFQGGFAHSDLEGITSPAYTILDYKNSNEHDSNYWKEIFVSQLFIKRLETITYGIRDGRSISFSEFSTLKFSCPSKLEQTAIGSFFCKFDNIISSQQSRLDKLKQLKSAYLQKMFV